MIVLKLIAAQDLARRYVRAVDMLAKAKEQYEHINSQFCAHQLAGLVGAERLWLKHVVDMKKHHLLENLYELGGGSGESHVVRTRQIA